MDAMSAPSKQPANCAFRRILDRFRRDHVKRTEDESFQLTDRASLRSAMKQIQDEQASKNKMRNMARLRGFLEGMEQYEKIVEVFLNTSELLAFVWGPMKFLLQITRNYVKAFDALLEKYEDMGEQLDVLAQHKNLFDTTDNVHLRKILEMIYEDITDFHAKALSYFKQSRWRTFFDVTWNNFQTRFSEPINNLKRHRHLLESHANLTVLEEVLAARDMQAETLKLQREEAKHQQRSRVCTWLAHEDMMADQEHYVDLRKEYPGTGTWILNRHPVKAWLDIGTGTDPMVWLTGIPGAGKSTLASVIIEAAMKNPDANVVFFYCKDGNQLRNNFLAMAKNLLYQLCIKDDRLAEYIDAEMSKEGQAVLQRPELAKKLVTIAMKSQEKLFVIIDGLDECLKPDKKEIIQWIQSKVAVCPETASDDDDDMTQPDTTSTMRLLLVSQEDAECTRLLKGYPTLKIGPEDNHDDIKAFCQYWEPKIRARHPKLQVGDGPAPITANVLDRAGGMFLYAKLVITNLHTQSKTFRLREELEWLRQDNGKLSAIGKLSEAYGRILGAMKHDVDDERYQEAMQVLSWIVVAQRDLFWHEIQGAVSLDLENREIDFEGRTFSSEDGPKDLCGSLLEHVDVLSQHINLTTLCLCYLNLGNVDTSLSDETIREYVMEGRYAFLDYAIAHWLDHLEKSMAKPASSLPQSAQESADSLSSEIRRFLDRHFRDIDNLHIPPKFMQDFQSFGLFNSQEFADALAQAAFQWSALFPKRPNRYRNKGKNSEDSQGPGSCSLRIFIPRLRAQQDHLARVFRSSRRGEDLHRYHGPGLFKCRFVHCDFFYTGFTDERARDSHQNRHENFHFCHFDGCPAGIIGFPDLKALNNHHVVAHSTASGYCNEEIQFPILTDPGSIDIEVAMKTGNLPAVQRWAEQFDGNIPIERIATREGERPGSKRWMPLKEAIQRRQMEIVKFMIGRVDDTGRAGALILYESMKHGDLPEFRDFALSIPVGAVQLGDVQDVLTVGDSVRNEDLALRVLKHYSAHPRNLSPSGTRSILHLMAKRGFLDCVRFLIDDCGLDANHLSKKRTVLIEAAEQGHETVIRFLLEGKYLTETTIGMESRGLSAADLAAANGHQGILSLLAADSYISSSRYQELVQIAQLRQAAIEGNPEIVSRLIDSGTPLDTLDVDLYSPFLHAVENDRTEVVRLLLTRGGDAISVNRACLCRRKRFHKFRGRPTATAIFIAIANRSQEIVELLLQHNSIDLKQRVLVNHAWNKGPDGFNSGGYPTAVELAAYLGYNKIKGLLEAHEPSIGTLAEVQADFVHKSTAAEEAEEPYDAVGYIGSDGSIKVMRPGRNGF
ncbi:hypothetical protein QBC40DRAFT_260708 [Triangularia verruculosa]|uniref:NACHT domain-containing protein n=1 Tax=Triangularia verruculosa TaxID=2587418 RepID=A0AAN6XXD3_9PEZI|nr:hypothetical protein QBC40DRAFT_260708 [Triangularia verruculosa]